MRIKAGDHAGDGVADEFLVVGGLDIAALYHAVNRGELLQFLQGKGVDIVARNSLRRYSDQRAGNNARAHPTGSLPF